jgi:hypothetical protein
MHDASDDHVVVARLVHVSIAHEAQVSPDGSGDQLTPTAQLATTGTDARVLGSG